MGFIPPNKSWNIKKKLTHTHTKESRDISGKFKKNKVLEQPFEISTISFLYSQGGGPERVSGLPRDTWQTGDRVGVRIGFPDSWSSVSSTPLGFPQVWKGMETPLGLGSLPVQAWSATAVLALSDMCVYLNRPLSVHASAPFTCSSVGSAGNWMKACS